MPFSIFRLRTLRGANVVGLLIGMSLFSMFFFISLYLQQVLGYDALKAGFAYLPLALSDHRLGRRRVAARHAGRLQADAASPACSSSPPALLWFSQVSRGRRPTLGDVLFPSLLAAIGLGLRVRARHDRARSPARGPTRPAWPPG